MFHLRKLFAAAALAAVALVAAPGQQAQAATLVDGSTLPAVIGDDYTFNIAPNLAPSTTIGPVAYVFTFTPAATNTKLSATFGYAQITPGTFSGGYLRWSDGTTITEAALVAGTPITLEIPLSAAGPDQTLTIGFDEQSGFGVLGGTVEVTEDDDVSTIPLPASGLLLLAGLGAIGLARRQSKLAA